MLKNPTNDRNYGKEQLCFRDFTREGERINPLGVPAEGEKVLKSTPSIKEMTSSFVDASSNTEPKVAGDERNLNPPKAVTGEVGKGTTDNTTGSRAWGNKVGFVLLPLSMRHREDPLDYVREIHTIMERKKASFKPSWIAFIAYLVIKMFGIKELVLHVLSYVDKVTFVVSASEKAIPDPEKLCDDFLYSLHLFKTSILSRGFAKN
ncbi:O-acyltransferase WSD1-like protein [Tanacetum coccineum]